MRTDDIEAALVALSMVRGPWKVAAEALGPTMASQLAIQAAEKIVELFGSEHVLDVRREPGSTRIDYTIQHPVACRPDLYDCEIHAVVVEEAERGLLPSPGLWYIRGDAEGVEYLAAR